MTPLGTYQNQEREVTFWLREGRWPEGPAPSLFARAEALRIERRLVDSLNKFREALLDDPDSPLARSALALFATRRDAAPPVLNETATQFPDLQRPQIYLASAEALSGRGSEAVHRLRYWTERTPDDAMVWDVLAGVLWRTREREAAADAALRVPELAPFSQPLQYRALKILASCGRRRDAARLAKGMGKTFGGRCRLLRWAVPWLGMGPSVAWIGLTVVAVLLGTTLIQPSWLLGPLAALSLIFGCWAIAFVIATAGRDDRLEMKRLIRELKSTQLRD